MPASRMAENVVSAHLDVVGRFPFNFVTSLFDPTFWMADCGNTLTISSSNAPASDCTTPCIGDPTQNCGGPTSLNLFWNGQKPQPAPQMAENPSNWYLWGCYE